MLLLWTDRTLCEAVSQERQAKCTLKPQVNHMESFTEQELIQGQVHHLSAEEAQENPEVVIGMFPDNNIPAMILFDSGASHSFISQSFAAQNKFSCSILEESMMVQSPGSMLKTNLVCRDLEIKIHGVVFPATLVAIESARLDVILGMD